MSHDPGASNDSASELSKLAAKLVALEEAYALLDKLSRSLEWDSFADVALNLLEIHDPGDDLTVRVPVGEDDHWSTEEILRIAAEVYINSGVDVTPLLTLLHNDVTRERLQAAKVSLHHISLKLNNAVSNAQANNLIASHPALADGLVPVSRCLHCGSLSEIPDLKSGDTVTVICKKCGGRTNWSNFSQPLGTGPSPLNTENHPVAQSTSPSLTDGDPDSLKIGKWIIRPGEANFNGGDFFDVDGVLRDLLIRLVEAKERTVLNERLKEACGNKVMEDVTLRNYVHKLNKILKKELHLTENPISCGGGAYRLRLPQPLQAPDQTANER